MVPDCLPLTSTLAAAGKATVAETAEAAMIEKRLKFMSVTLVFVWLSGRGRPWNQTYARGLNLRNALKQ